MTRSKNLAFTTPLKGNLALCDPCDDADLHRIRDLYKFIWVREGRVQLRIDHIPLELHAGELVPLTPHHRLEIPQIDAEVLILAFDSNFYCIFGHDGEVSCSGLLFNGTSELLRLELNEERAAALGRVIDDLRAEYEVADGLREEMLRIGGVGQAARASGVARDLRSSHPWGPYTGLLRHEPVVRTQGDVMARLMVRCREVLQSAQYIDRLLEAWRSPAGELPAPDYTAPLAPDSLSVGLVEGWRGEICHAVVTDSSGRIAACRIKDPSLHNWLALALAVRGEGISDFPICNKSFNLSYCGHDL